MAEMSDAQTLNVSQVEKDNSTSRSRQLFAEQENARDGYILDAGQLRSDLGTLKTAPDGHTLLIPQPTKDPNDPMNWSRIKKHIILFVISAIAFLPDYGSSLGAVTLIPQSKQWHLPEAIVQHNLVGNLFCLGAGGLFTVALSDYFGRAPILLFFQLMVRQERKAIIRVRR